MIPLLSLGTAEAQHASHVASTSLEEVRINDNRKPAGELRNGVYYIDLEIREGNWYPESKEGSPIKIKALAEAGKPLQVPGPLIRVSEGTEIRARITNHIKDYPQELLGFYKRPVERSKVFEALLIAPGETKEVTFDPGRAGTYFYAVKDHNKGSYIPAARSSHSFPYLRSQAYGALIVDAKDELPDPQERIILIGSAGVPSDSKEEVATTWVLNGLSWPYTERLQYRQGETVKWRVINISKFSHPMHLHGFPFTIKSLLDLTGAVTIGKENERLEVTHTVQIFETMRISWVPEKTDNWLFHCHLVNHILPLTNLRDHGKMDHASMDTKTHAANGMGGLIMGITILPKKNFSTKNLTKSLSERKLTLMVGETKTFDGANGKGFKLIENRKPTTEGFSIPGPPLILYKDQPVAIKIVNTSKEPTTIHWHGLEIESYYDGAAGWGTKGKELAPLIPPGGSFTVHITPPRAGTFMYHTHMHDLQLLQGMYGALVVLERGEKFDPETDKIFVLGQGGKDLHIPTTVFVKNPDHVFGEVKWLLNGTDKPEPLSLRKGRSYRFRFINIGAERDRVPVSIRKGDQFSEWTMIAKDGMSLPDGQRKTASATQAIAIGETYDFQFIPATAGDYVLLIGNPGNPNAKPPIPQRIEITQLIKVVE